MQTIAILLIFVGMLMITHGVYEEKLRSVQQSVRVEHRFVPRTYLEEQHTSNPNLTGLYNNMFDKTSPWMDDRRNDAGMMSEAII